MDALSEKPGRGFDPLAPFHVFSEAEWARLRADEPMTLSREEILSLQGFNDQMDPAQVETIYLPLARLLRLYIDATEGLHQATRRFLGSRDGKMPFVIGIAGSVAVGKTTTARLLQALLAREPSRPKVDLVPTDGFLLPNRMLQEHGLMERKGFPESYDYYAIIEFLSDVKAGERHVEAPVYSHLTYDRVPGETIEVDRPDVLIVEGLNVLQTRRLSSDRPPVPFVSDFFDFSIYIDADEDALERWYLTRFNRLKETRFRDPRSYFHKYAGISDEAAQEFARGLWERINLKNLRENIRPTKLRADLILRKDDDHRISQVALRKI